MPSAEKCVASNRFCGTLFMDGSGRSRRHKVAVRGYRLDSWLAFCLHTFLHYRTFGKWGAIYACLFVLCVVVGCMYRVFRYHLHTKQTPREEHGPARWLPRFLSPFWLFQLQDAEAGVVHFEPLSVFLFFYWSSPRTAIFLKKYI